MRIDKEFQALIPPLTPEEFAGLENNILTNGCRTPLDVWSDILVDGHNRFEICQKHEIPYETKAIEFADRDAALMWIIRNQLDRRNISDFVRFELTDRQTDILKEQGRKKKVQTLKQNNTWDSTVLSKIDKTVSTPEKHDTRKEIAKSLGWGNHKVAQAKIVKEKATPEVKEKLRRGETTINQVYTEIKKKKKAAKLEKEKEKKADLLKRRVSDNRPVIHEMDCLEFLDTIEDRSVDLVFTDPPYSTDVKDIAGFARSWVLKALAKVKETGRAFICIGAYPVEVKAYLDVFLASNYIVDAPLIWTYRNTLGVTPKMKYNLNYQMILHIYTEQSRELDTSITNEMFSVQDITAPDGRHGTRFHAWQKPDELGMRLVKHTTQEGDKVIDCFACTGTFLLMAAKLRRIGIGCDISKDNLAIAETRGAHVIYK